MSAHQQQRQAERIQPYVAPCRWVHGDRRVPAYITDLSPIGARVYTEPEPPAPETRLVVELRLGDSAVHQRLAATVEWVRPADRGGFMFGVSFAEAGGGERLALEKAVAEFRRLAAAIESPRS